MLSEGQNFEFGYNAIAPRRVEIFAQRLEEALNRRRFYAGQEPIVIQAERSRKERKKDKG